MRGLWIRLGTLLLLIGIGSVILHSFTIYQFRYLMWADGAQPYVGLGIAAAGIALWGLPRLRPAHTEPDQQPDPQDNADLEHTVRLDYPVDPPTIPIPIDGSRRHRW